MGPLSCLGAMSANRNLENFHVLQILHSEPHIYKSYSMKQLALFLQFLFLFLHPYPCLSHPASLSLFLSFILFLFISLLIWTISLVTER